MSGNQDLKNWRIALGHPLENFWMEMWPKIQSISQKPRFAGAQIAPVNPYDNSYSIQIAVVSGAIVLSFYEKEKIRFTVSRQATGQTYNIEQHWPDSQFGVAEAVMMVNRIVARIRSEEFVLTNRRTRVSVRVVG